MREAWRYTERLRPGANLHTRRFAASCGAPELRALHLDGAAKMSSCGSFHGDRPDAPKGLS